MPNTTSADNGVLLTVPAGKMWMGTVTLSASLASGTGASGAAAAAPSVIVSGSGGNLTDGDTVTKLQLNTPAQLLGTLSGTVASSSVAVPGLIIQAKSGDVSLVLKLGNSTAACATALGEMK